jgi:Zn finger protein HypA/HybF involved in hydrogenase expression
MKRQDIFCEYCDTECTVETLNMENPITFCPICGSEVDYEVDYDGEDFNEDDDVYRW